MSRQVHRFPARGFRPRFSRVSAASPNQERHDDALRGSHQRPDPERSSVRSARREAEASGVVRRVNVAGSSPTGPGLRLRFRASVDSVPHARHRLSDWLAELGVPKSTVDDMALAITELVTNAVEASPTASAPILVHATYSDHDLCIEVIDEGQGFTLDDSSDRPGPQSIRGRGLPIVRALVDLVEVDRSDGRTRVVATCRLTRHV